MECNAHPTYPNPTIREALCEIHFRLPEGQSWQPALFSRFFRRIESEFPVMEPVTEAGFQLQLHSGRAEFAPPRSRMRYRHADRPLLLQVSDSILTVNMLPPYTGWQQLHSDIDHAWAWADEVFQPAGITRIGLRYINIIPQLAEEPAGDWLAPNDFVAAAALASLPGFLSRAEVRYSAQTRTIVTVAGAADADSSHFLLDIDCITEQPNDDLLPLDPTLTELHDRVWSVFAGFLTPRYHMHLQGGSQ
ncbi:MAG: TIGR04255 family protein [Chloroflexota bacterium]|nr:TIGR04255 family protein [Chloroflexota bacterium]